MNEAWSSRSNEAIRERNHLRSSFRHGDKKPEARCVEFQCSEAELRADAASNPREYFKCRACGTGPWHITWGGICPNCSGAD